MKKIDIFQVLIISLLSIITLQFNFTQTNKSAEAQSLKQQTKQQNKSNKVGKFILNYQPSSDNKTKNYIQNRRIFDDIIRNLNSSGLVIRQNVSVVLEDCGTANAFWDNQNKRIIMCYELFNVSVDNFKTLGYSEEQSKERAIDNFIFIFYHELGHGLIDMLPLNAVGQEEDTVDEFASVMMYRKYSPNRAGDIILSASEFFLFTDSPAWGEHTPGKRRLFNLVCFVFGSDPEKYEKIFVRRLVALNDGVRPNDEKIGRRARRCYNAFVQKTDQWNRLLLPHYATVNDSQPNGTTSNTSTPGVSHKDPTDIW